MVGCTSWSPRFTTCRVYATLHGFASWVLPAGLLAWYLSVALRDEGVDGVWVPLRIHVSEDVGVELPVVNLCSRLSLSAQTFAADRI
jgi:hypothetical protein